MKRLDGKATDAEIEILNETKSPVASLGERRKATDAEPLRADVHFLEAAGCFWRHRCPRKRPDDYNVFFFSLNSVQSKTRLDTIFQHVNHIS